MVVSKSAKSASYGHGSLVCGLWLAGGGGGGSVPTYVLGTFYIRFFMYQGYERWKNCKPSCTQKYPFMRRGICRTYVRNGTKMYGNRNDYRPPLDEASKIIWIILLR